MINATPALKPVTFALSVPAGVIDVPDVLAQLPPAIRSLMIIDEPIHTVVGPTNPEGLRLTVTIVVVTVPDIV